MFWRILKKDLKRKRTMNIILLLFVIICSMFAAASVNNIIAVTGGIEHYFELAQLPDVVVEVSSYTENDYAEQISALPSVKDMKVSDTLFVMGSKNFKLHGKKLDNFYNPAVMLSDDQMYINYFDTDNEVIKGVDKGSFYATAPFEDGLDIKKGDEVDLTIGDTSMKLKYAGRFKGAIFGSDSNANSIILLDSEDFMAFDKEEDAHFMYNKMLFINGADKAELDTFAEEHGDVYVNTKDDYKDIYLYDMIAATIMMMISILLLVTAFVMLKFSIGFTIAEEFREIGVMKTIGIPNLSIRVLYITKYLAIAITGALAGFLCSLPLTNLMLKTISENMVLKNENSMAFGALSSLGVVAVILLFCYISTRRVKKLSPIDAVRSGQTGERFKKRGLLHLGRSRLSSTGFLAVNDILSAPKQFGIMTIVFALSLLMITMMSNFSLTLQNDEIYPFFDISKSDATILDTAYFKDVFLDQANTEKLINDTEKMLDDNGIPGKCSMTLFSRGKAFYGDKQARLIFGVLKGHIDEELTVDEGSVPMKNDEAMLTVSAMEALGVKIGDHISADIGGKMYEFIITGKHSTFQSHAVFLYKDFDTSGLPAGGSVGLQIRFDGDPDEEQTGKNIDKIKSLIDSDKVYTISEMIKNFTGISDMLDTIKLMIMILTVIVTALISVLMERSFISKEKSEIALMKAVGITNGSIVLQHTLRFVIVSVIACAISSAFMMPLSDLLMNRVCLLIGDVSGIKCIFDPIEVFIIAPLLIIGVTCISSLLTALYTKTIKSSDTASIE